MKFLNKLTLIIYANLMLIMSIIMCLIIFGWLDLKIMLNLFENIILYDVSANIVLVISIIFILLSIKVIFFSSGDKNDITKNGVLLENESGKLMISKETIENLVNSVAKGFSGAEEISTKVVLDAENNLSIFVNMTVSPNVVIKELSSNVQNKIKEVIKKASDLEVKEVNIKVKNIAPKTSGISE